MVGLNFAKSDAKTVVNSTIDVINEFVTTCDFSQVNSLVIGGPNCNVIIKNTSITQTAAFDTQCVSNLTADNDLEQKIQETIQQQTEALAAALQFDITGAFGISIIESVTNLVTRVKNTYLNSCTVTQANQAILDCSSGSITLEGDDITQSANLSAVCIFNNSAINKAINDLQLLLDQKTTASTSFFSPWVIAIIVVVIIIIIIIIIIAVVANNSSTESTT